MVGLAVGSYLSIHMFAPHGHAGQATQADLTKAQAAATGQPSPSPSWSHKAAIAIKFAVGKVGLPYRWGGCGPTDVCAAYGDAPSDGYDCSGLLFVAWKQAGVTIPRTSQTQWSGLQHIPLSQLKPGDLLLYPGADGTPADPGHVAMYIGHGQMVEAFSTDVGIRTTSVRHADLVGVARP